MGAGNLKHNPGAISDNAQTPKGSSAKLNIRHPFRMVAAEAHGAYNSCWRAS